MSHVVRLAPQDDGTVRYSHCVDDDADYVEIDTATALRLLATAGTIAEVAVNHPTAPHSNIESSGIMQVI